MRHSRIISLKPPEVSAALARGIALSLASALTFLFFTSCQPKEEKGRLKEKLHLKYDSTLIQTLRSGPDRTEGKEHSPHEEGVRILTVTPSRGGDPGTLEIVIDASKQVLSLDIPEDREENGSLMGDPQTVPTPLFPTLKEAGVNPERFIPATFLALKAKFFDDGLYAAVELGATQGAGTFPSRTAFFEELLKVLTEGGSSEDSLEATSLVAAAARLGGLETDLPRKVKRRSLLIEEEYLNDSVKLVLPVGFYTWSRELEGIYRRDRLLQTVLQEESPGRPMPLKPPGLTLALALSEKENLVSAYNASLQLNERLTATFGWNDLRGAVSTLNSKGNPFVEKAVSLFPPSRPLETELLKKLFANKSVPEGFSLADEMVSRIREGSLNLQPHPKAGWYDYQMFALEPLVIPDEMPEREHLVMRDSYKKELLALFKSLVALTRETHIKQLEAMKFGDSWPPEIIIRPGITLEPLATYYLRRARSYQFVRGVLTESFGREGLREMKRLTPSGRLDLNLGEEIRLLEGIFHGAYLTACEELGMPSETIYDLGSGHGPRADRLLFKLWARSASGDPDLSRDMRMMVPLGYDVERKRYKVWAIMGISKKPLVIDFVYPLRVKAIRDQSGGEVDQSRFKVGVEDEKHDLAYLVMAEVYVENLLNRAQFREHCDHHKTAEDILRHLR